MAIFGNVADMPIPDVLSMVGRGSGRFFVWGLPDDLKVEMHIAHGRMRSMFVNDAPCEDVLQVRSHMIDMLKAPAGEFEFEKVPAQELMDNLEVELDQLILASLSAIDEIEAFREHFPSARTYFRTVDSREAWLDDGLRSFWETAEPLLRQGANPAILAEETGLTMDEVCLGLYKLRSAGLVTPVRRHAATQSVGDFGASLHSAPLAAPAKSPQAARRPEAREGAPQNDAMVAHDLTGVKIQQPADDFLLRVMSRIRESFLHS